MYFQCVCCKHRARSCSRSHATDRCYTKQNKKQKESKFPLPVSTSVSPLSQHSSLTRYLGQGLGSHPWSVKLGFEHNQMRLLTAVHLQTPCSFRGMVSTSVRSSVAHVLCTKVMNLSSKGAVETVLPAHSKSGFYSRNFIVPKKDGNLLRPIFYLRHLDQHGQ